MTDPLPDPTKPDPARLDPTRLDVALVARGAAPSRAKARALIEAGVVEVNGQRATKPSLPVGPEDDLSVTHDPNPYVSRAALKLVAALDHFAPDLTGKTALDLGASTGGFTQVLLERGAAHVVAVDVGRDQLAPPLQGHPRVTSHEGVNARALTSLELPPYHIITADLSFISLHLALPPALERAPEGAWLLALIKPQFEVGRALIGKGGVVKDRAAQEQACKGVSAFVTDAGWRVMDIIDSPITGMDGNREFLMGALKTGDCCGAG